MACDYEDGKSFASSRWKWRAKQMAFSSVIPLPQLQLDLQVLALLQSTNHNSIGGQLGGYIQTLRFSKSPAQHACEINGLQLFLPQPCEANILHHDGKGQKQEVVAHLVRFYGVHMFKRPQLGLSLRGLLQDLSNLGFCRNCLALDTCSEILEPGTEGLHG